LLFGHHPLRRLRSRSPSTANAAICVLSPATPPNQECATACTGNRLELRQQRIGSGCVNETLAWDQACRANEADIGLAGR
jgi:hypothetical protein